MVFNKVAADRYLERGQVGWDVEGPRAPGHVTVGVERFGAVHSPLFVVLLQNDAPLVRDATKRKAGPEA